METSLNLTERINSITANFNKELRNKNFNYSFPLEIAFAGSLVLALLCPKEYNEFISADLRPYGLAAAILINSLYVNANLRSD